MWRRCAPSREAGIWGVFAFRTCELGGPGGVSAAHAQLVLQLLPLRLPPLHHAAEPGGLGLQPQQLHRYRHKDTDTRIQRYKDMTETQTQLQMLSSPPGCVWSSAPVSPSPVGGFSSCSSCPVLLHLLLLLLLMLPHCSAPPPASSCCSWLAPP